MQKTILSLILFAIGLEAQQTLYAVTPDGLLSPLTPVSATFSPYRVVADGSGGAIIHDGSNIYRPSSEGLQRATGFSQLGFNTNMVAAGLNGDLYIANNQTTLGARPKIYLRRRDGSVIFLGGAQDSSGSNLIDYYGPAIGASIGFLDGLSFDHTSRVLFLNQGSIIKAIDANQFISWFAGNPFDFVGSGRILASLATSSGIYAPNAGFASGRVKIAAYQGVLFVADGCRIYRITPDWLLRPYAGGECGFTGDGVTAAQARFGPIGNLAVSPEGLYVADGNQVKLIALDGKVSTIVGASHYGGDGGPATAARMDRPEAILFNAARNLIIADNGNGRLRSLQTDGTIRSFGGTSLSLSSMALDSDGSIVGVNSGGQVVRIATNGAVTPIASLLFAFGVAIDSARNIYASAQAQIQKISPAGTMTAFASDDGQGYLGLRQTGHAAPPSSQRGNSQVCGRWQVHGPHQRAAFRATAVRERFNYSRRFAFQCWWNLQNNDRRHSGNPANQLDEGDRRGSRDQRRLLRELWRSGVAVFPRYR